MLSQVDTLPLPMMPIGFIPDVRHVEAKKNGPLFRTGLEKWPAWDQVPRGSSTLLVSQASDLRL